MWEFDLLLAGRKRGGQRILLTPVFQVSLAENNPYIEVAYFEVASSATLQFPMIKH